MSTKNYSTYIPKLTQPLSHAGTNGSIWAHFLGRLQQLLGWLARRRKEESQPNMDVNYELENDRFTENGYFRISEEQSRLERVIKLNGVNLRIKRNL